MIGLNMALFDCLSSLVWYYTILVVKRLKPPILWLFWVGFYFERIVAYLSSVRGQQVRQACQLPLTPQSNYEWYVVGFFFQKTTNHKGMSNNLRQLDMYVLVHWPESQIVMDCERADECVLNFDESASYFVPYELYKELFG